MSSLLDRDIKCVITTLQTKKIIVIKSISKGRMMTTSMLLSAKRLQYNQEATLPYLGFTVEKKPTLQCNCKVAYRIAKCKKLHTIAEELIKPCAEKMVEIIIIISGRKRKSSEFCSLMTPFAGGLTTWLLMCASKFAPNSSKARSRLAFNWTSLTIAL